MPPALPPSTLIAVDVGNSRVKLGRFDRAFAGTSPGGAAHPPLPEPSATLELSPGEPTDGSSGERFAAWCAAHVDTAAPWRVASVHRGAADQLVAAVARLAAVRHAHWPLRRLTHRDLGLPVDLDAPERVGIDRLAAALAADRLRSPGRAAVVVDLGTAITVDLLRADGTFAGGAILAGLAMSAEALHRQTDALPRVAVDRWQHPPLPLGRSTVPAIEAGLFWGAVGAIGQLAAQFSRGQAAAEVLVTGGGAALVAATLATECELPVQHVPHLVLSGIALADAH